MGLLFDVFNAITGTPDEPAAHNMPANARLVLLALANRAKSGRAWQSVATLAAETGRGQSTVKACLAELEDHGCIRHDGWHGKMGHASKVFAIIVSGWKPWQPNGDRHRAPPSSRRQSNRGGEIAAVQLSDSQTVAVRPSNGGYKPLSEPPIEPLREPTAPIAPGVQALPGFEGVAAAAKKPAKVAKPPKPPPAPKASKVLAADQYAAAYIAGHAAAGGTMAALTTAEKAFLGRAASAHARYRDGSPITGDELVAWFRRRAEDFRRHVEDFAHHAGGSSPRGFLAWLNNGHDGASRPWAPGTKPAPLPHAPTPLRMPPGMDTPEARAEARAIVLEAFPQYRSTLEAVPNG